MFLILAGILSMILGVLVLALRLAFWLLKGALGIGLFALAVWLIVRGIQSTRSPR